MTMNRKCATVQFFLLMISAAPSALADDNATVKWEGLHDVHAPVAYPASYGWLLIVLALLVIAGCILAVMKWKRRGGMTPPVPVDTRTPWEIAYAQLEQLDKAGYLEEGQFKGYYSELSGIIRNYFENRFAIRAPEMTTEEFLWSLECSGDLKTEQKETLKKFMTSCDIIKFAKHIPRIEEAAESFRFARQLVDETKIVEPAV